MATKKKAAKKATKKRAYNRKEPVTKRAYNRKPKPEPATLIEVDAAQVDTAVKQNQEKAQGEAKSAESNSSILQQIQVIDLRNSNVLHRVAVLSMLEKEGYINEQLESPLNAENLTRQNLFADALRLNHNNKIISFENWEDVAGSYSISRATVYHQTQINFSHPEPHHEQIIRMGGAIYVRVQ